MKTIGVVLIVIFCMLPAAITAAGAVYLATHGVDGWGWFLFASTVLSFSLSINGTNL